MTDYDWREKMANAFLSRQLVNAVLVVVFAMAADLCYSQSFPVKPVRFVIPVPAGTPTDIAMRIVATKLQDRLGWTTVAENRPGGNFNPAVLSVIQAPA